MKIDIGKGLEKLEHDGTFSSILRVELSHATLKAFSLIIIIEGIFEAGEDLKIKLDDFLNINGPAIIYPYARQIVRNTSLESMQPLMLPVMDFVAFHQSRKKEKIDKVKEA